MLTVLAGAWTAVRAWLGTDAGAFVARILLWVALGGVLLLAVNHALGWRTDRDLALVRATTAERLVRDNEKARVDQLADVATQTDLVLSDVHFEAVVLPEVAVLKERVRHAPGAADPVPDDLDTALDRLVLLDAATGAEAGPVARADPARAARRGVPGAAGTAAARP